MSKDWAKVKKIGLTTTIAFVIANMVGTGVFTTLGYQYKAIPNALVILIIWILGGVIALCGALVYSELGATMPRSGGEYHYLSKIYHPWLGFLSGWVSITIGFAAPVALASMALGYYTNGVFPLVQPQLIAIGVIVLITLVHTYDIKFGGNFQNIFTAFKILLILVFIICGFLLTSSFQDFSIHVNSFSFKDLFKPEVAVALIFVNYAFSGWNASAYIASDIKEPQRTIPRSLLISTMVVTILYFMLNFTFVLTAPRTEYILDANLGDPGLISAHHIFGRTGGHVMGMLISVLLISTISSMIFVGPRVSQVMGEDMQMFRFLSVRTKKHGTPIVAIMIQSVISITLIITSSFKLIFTATSFALSFFTLLAVLGVFIHRIKYKDAVRPYKTWGFPVIPIIYLAIVVWTLYFTFSSEGIKSAILLIAAIVSGSVIYGINYLFEKRIKIKNY
jgi:APA family basic amino acid/polyamine antiporter